MVWVGIFLGGLCFFVIGDFHLIKEWIGKVQHSAFISISTNCSDSGRAYSLEAGLLSLCRSSVPELNAL